MNVPSTRISVLWISLLVMVASQLDARSRALLRDGKTFSGEVMATEYRFVSIDGAVLRIPRASLHRLEASEGGSLSATLKDGTSFVGHLETDIELVDGLLTRVLSPESLASIDFDIYVPLTSGAGRQTVCPIRAELELPLDTLLAKKRAKFSSYLITAVRCEGRFIGSLDFKLRKNVTEWRFPKGEEPRKGFELAVRPVVFLPNGRDQEVHLTFILVQDGRKLARGSRLSEGDEGEFNYFEPTRLWYAADGIDESGPAPVLWIQMVTAESKQDREKGTVFWWFTLRLPL